MTWTEQNLNQDAIVTAKHCLIEQNTVMQSQCPEITVAAELRNAYVQKAKS